MRQSAGELQVLQRRAPVGPGPVAQSRLKAADTGQQVRALVLSWVYSSFRVDLTVRVTARIYTMTVTLADFNVHQLISLT